MLESHSPRVAVEPMSREGVVLRLIIAWIWVGVPLALGVYQTVLKAEALFK